MYFPITRLLIIFQKIFAEERVPIVVLDIECLEGKIVTDLGINNDRNAPGFTFLSPADNKLFKHDGTQKTSNGKLNYS